ncbi:hypothetical protein HDV00_002346 [Rhizophlyctis rosea]|nr:hypothetical protein HDV00_002346 [Rhizophlyctis rosea]
MLSLQALSTELHLLICSHLTTADILMLAQTSRSFRQFGRDSGFHQELRQPHTGRTTSAFLQFYLPKVAKATLTRLDLSGVFWVTQSDLVRSVKVCKQLETLIFDRRTMFGLAGVFTLLKSLLKLTELAISLDIFWSGDAIPPFEILGINERSKIPKLKSLSLCLDNNLQADVLRGFFVSTTLINASLQTLRLWIKDDFGQASLEVAKAISRMPKLTHFESHQELVHLPAMNGLTALHVVRADIAHQESGISMWKQYASTIESLEVPLTFLNQPHADEFVDALAMMRNLRVLNLDWVVLGGLDDGHAGYLDTIVTNCQHLTDISIRYWMKNPTQDVVDKLSTLPALKNVDIRDNAIDIRPLFINGSWPPTGGAASTTPETSSLPTDALDPPSVSSPTPQWSTYKLSINTSNLQYLLHHLPNALPNLTTLHISTTANTTLTNTDLTILSRAAPNIASFTVLSRDGATITDTGLSTALSTWSKTLHTLRLHRCPKILTQPPLPAAISKCKRLRHLSLSRVGPETSYTALYYLKDIIAGLGRNTFEVLEVVHPNFDVKSGVVDALVEKFGVVSGEGGGGDGDEMEVVGKGKAPATLPPETIKSPSSTTLRRISLLGPRTTLQDPIPSLKRLCSSLPWLAELELCVRSTKTEIKRIEQVVRQREWEGQGPRKVVVWDSGEVGVECPTTVGARGLLVYEVREGGREGGMDVASVYLVGVMWGEGGAGRGGEWGGAV